MSEMQVGKIEFSQDYTVIGLSNYIGVLEEKIRDLEFKLELKQQTIDILRETSE